MLFAAPLGIPDGQDIFFISMVVRNQELQLLRSRMALFLSQYDKHHKVACHTCLSEGGVVRPHSNLGLLGHADCISYNKSTHS